MPVEKDWERLRRYARRIAWKYKRHPDLVEELASAGLEALIFKEDKFRTDGSASFYTWAHEVMRNAIVDQLRKENREYRVTQLLLPGMTWAGSISVQIERFWSELRHLLTPTELRIAEVYLVHGDIADAEIAEKAAVQSKGSVRVHRSSIRRKIKTLEKKDINGNRVMNGSKKEFRDD